MKELSLEFNKYNKKCKILSLEFLRKYAYNIIKKYGADYYINNIRMHQLLCDYDMIYNFDSRIIDIYIAQIKTDIIYENEVYYKKHPDQYVKTINKNLIYSITHECFHAIQNKFICDIDNMQRLASSLFRDSMQIKKYNMTLYYQLYEYFPIEVNAEIMACLFGTNFLNIAEPNNTALNNMQAIKDILNIYSIDDIYIYPTEVFYKTINEDKRYNELTINISKSNYKRMILGLPIDDYYIKKLEQIKYGNIEVKDVKKYLKKI